MSDIRVTFEHEGKTIRDNFNLGTLEQGQASQEFLINIRHNSNRPIKDCGLYVTPYTNIYNGSANPSSDLKKLIWYADNYQETGLSISQEYLVYGEIYIQESRRLIDITRTEDKDFFLGSEIEILSGPLTGEKQLIKSFDPFNNMFILHNDFSGPVNGERYKIEIKTKHYIKNRQGTASGYAIPLLYNGGTINRFETASIKLQLTIPPFMKDAGNSLFNLNMKYTPEE